MIQVLDVSKRYGGKAVVDGVSIRIPKGKITSLIGPNGAGKSTLLSIISRLVRKDDGEVWIEDKEVGKSKSAELAKTVSILKQTNHVHVRLTVKELVGFGRFPYCKGRLTPEDERKVAEAIHYMKLEDMQDKYLDELSGGQRQRAFIAMTLAQDTEYMMLDEPLNNLDMKHAVQIMKVLRRLVDELGKTIILVLHDINFASWYSDFIVAMKDGKVVHSGTVDEIINSGVLLDIYDLEIPVENMCGKKVCVFYSS